MTQSGTRRPLSSYGSVLMLREPDGMAALVRTGKDLVQRIDCEAYTMREPGRGGDRISSSASPSRVSLT